MTSLRFKCAMIGDAEIGKSSIIHQFAFENFTHMYIPTTHETYNVTKRVVVESQTSSVSKKISLNICDTGGHDDLERLRPLCYSKADVLIVCFSVVNPSSFKNVRAKWIKEVRRHVNMKAVSIILVGTQTDRRSDVKFLLNLSEKGLAPLPETKCLRLAKKIGAINYIECSALTAKNITKIFDECVLAGLRRLEKRFTVSRSSLAVNRILEDPKPKSKVTNGKRIFNSESIKTSLPSGDGLTRNGVKKLTTNGSVAIEKKGGGGGRISAITSSISSQLRRLKKTSNLKRFLLTSCISA